MQPVCIFLKKKMTLRKKKPWNSVFFSQGGLETMLFIKCFEILSKSNIEEEKRIIFQEDISNF